MHCALCASYHVPHVAERVWLVHRFVCSCLNLKWFKFIVTLPLVWTQRSDPLFWIRKRDRKTGAPIIFVSGPFCPGIHNCMKFACF